ncbi:MAG: hypothetical protein M1609_08355 [Firmicutes bacterium]|nr:hypothetical protein [Bacillota bacterium]
MPGALHIGHVVLNTQWLVIIVSVLSAYFVIRYRLKAGGIGERVIEAIENNLIIAIVVWKFSLLVFEPVTVLTNPLVLLYFSGGVPGVWLAAVVVVSFFYYRSRKDRVSIWVYGDLLAAGFLTAWAVYYLIDLFVSKQAIWISGSEVLLALLILLLSSLRGPVGKPAKINQIIFWFSIGQVGILVLDRFKQNFWAGFSQAQILYLILAATCLSLDWLAEKKRQNRKA